MTSWLVNVQKSHQPTIGDISSPIDTWFGDERNHVTMEFYDIPYIGNVIIPTDDDFHIFQRSRYTNIYQPPTSHDCNP
jgi:hypothetical protein